MVVNASTFCVKATFENKLIGVDQMMKIIMSATFAETKFFAKD